MRNSLSSTTDPSAFSTVIRRTLQQKITTRTWDLKQKIIFRLRDTLLDIKGKFLVSYNDCPEIREIWDKPNIHIDEISRLNNLAQRYDGGCQYAELLISNYDTSERAKAIKQLSLFD